MAEGTTSSFDPVTGERRNSTFQYTPVQPPRQGSITPAQANAMVQAVARTSPEKAMALAMQLKGRMGYERDIAAGKTPQEALMRNAQNIFFSQAGGGSMVRSMAITPQQEAANKLDQARFEQSKKDAETRAKSLQGYRDWQMNKPTSSTTQDPVKLFSSAASLAEIASKLAPSDPNREVFKNASSSILRQAQELMNKPNPLSQAGQPARIVTPKGPLTRAIAESFVIKAANGKPVTLQHRKLAEQMARDAGYDF